MEDDGEENGNDDGQNGGGMGLADGKGKKDVSDRIESEDQLEDAKPADQEENQQDEDDCPEEEKGIETSEDFGGKAQGMKEKNDESDGEDEDNAEELDKEMGETEEGADQLDKELWNSDDENDDAENENEMKDDQGKGEKTGEDNVYAAKEDEANESNDESSGQKNRSKPDITEMDDEGDEGEQIDPYHGNMEPLPEPEDFDLPDDIQLDDDEDKDKGQEDTENPFDIDELKEDVPNNKKVDDEEINTQPDEIMDDTEQPEENIDNENNEEPDSTNNDKTMDAESNDNPEDDEQTDENMAIDETYQPSKDTPTDASAERAPDSKGSGSKDQVSGEQMQQGDVGDAQDKKEDEAEAMGGSQAQHEQDSSGHDAGQATQASLSSNQSQNEKKKYEKPGKSNVDRSIEENVTRNVKRMQTIEKSTQEIGEDEQGNDQADKEVDAVQHIKKAGDRSMMQVLDAATEEQMESQPIPNLEHEDADQPDDTPMDIDENNEDLPIDLSEIEKISAKQGESNQSDQPKSDVAGSGNLSDDVKSSAEGEVVVTMSVERGKESFLNVSAAGDQNEPLKPLLTEEIEIIRVEIQKQLALLNTGVAVSAECAHAWQMINSTVSGLSRELSEQLRLILEPSRATRFKGDYRSGRRINMRKVISYIASEFRKDRIWLRRTKPWKREHQIVLAIDDSSSMSDNKSKELAFESLALVSNSLNLLEAGDLSVVSFGESCRVLHPLGEPFTDETGARLLSKLNFDQNKTRVAAAIDLSLQMFRKSKVRDAAQLLLLVSDGRGVFSEGLENVQYAVRRANAMNVFIVFVIIDDPKSKDSIMDIRMPEFKDGKLLGIKPYMENFPFPYYVILRDINALPGTLCDALRQWFLITTPQV